MTKILKFALIIGLVFAGLTSKAQVGITYYFNQSRSAIGVNVPFANSDKGEMFASLKLFTNTKFDLVTPEINLGYTFKPQEYLHYSLALGWYAKEIFNGSDDSGSFVIPLSIEVRPLSDFRNVAFLFELTPEFEFEGDALLRSMIGIRYSF